MAVIVNSYGTLLDNLIMDTVSIYGMASRPPRVKLNEVELEDSKWTFNNDTNVSIHMHERFLIGKSPESVTLQRKKKNLYSAVHISEVIKRTFS